MKKYLAALLLAVCMVMGAAYATEGYTGYDAGPGYACAGEPDAGVEFAPFCDGDDTAKRPRLT